MRLLCIDAEPKCPFMYPAKLVENHVYNSPGLEGGKDGFCPLCRIINEFYRIDELSGMKFPMEHFIPLEDGEELYEEIMKPEVEIMVEALF